MLSVLINYKKIPTVVVSNLVVSGIVPAFLSLFDLFLPIHSDELEKYNILERKNVGLNAGGVAKSLITCQIRAFPCLSLSSGFNFDAVRLPNVLPAVVGGN